VRIVRRRISTPSALFPHFLESAGE